MSRHSNLGIHRRYHSQNLPAIPFPMIALQWTQVHPRNQVPIRLPLMGILHYFLDPSQAIAMTLSCCGSPDCWNSWKSLCLIPMISTPFLEILPIIRLAFCLVGSVTPLRVLRNKSGTRRCRRSAHQWSGSLVEWSRTGHFLIFMQAWRCFLFPLLSTTRSVPFSQTFTTRSMLERQPSTLSVPLPVRVPWPSSSISTLLA